jgi:cyclic pyranopterin phosphate synthase
MPDTPITFHPTAQLLTFEEISQVVRLLVPRGIGKIRVTGGEPLLRRQLDRLIAMLNSIDGVNDLAITTNGILLEEQVEKLVAAGLRRINVSLDTLQSSTFKVLARRDGVERVMAGIAAAMRYQQLTLKLNALILRDINLAEVLELARFAANLSIPLRFIEFMPLDAERAWSEQRMVSGAELREKLERVFGALTPAETPSAAQPSVDYITRDGQLFGFINTVTEPFCGGCDRLRLTADGKLRNCLFGQEEWDLRKLLRSDYQLASNVHALFDACLAAKHFAHGSPQSQLQSPQRAMYQIGG